MSSLITTLRQAMNLFFILGQTDDTVVRHSVLAKDEAFLQKPLTPDALARTVGDVLDGRKAGGEA